MAHALPPDLRRALGLGGGDIDRATQTGDLEALPHDLRSVLRASRTASLEDCWGRRGLLRLFAVLLIEERLRATPGWFPASPWWLDVVSEALPREYRRVFCRVGRRGGKSSSICRFAVGEVFAGLMGWAHDVSAGDVGTVVIVSAIKEQAGDRTDTIAAILDACKVDHKPRFQRVELKDGPYRFKAYAANKGAVVSQSTSVAMLDEVAHWRDDDSGKNPARAIIKALSPSMINDPDAIMWGISSPWVEDDVHAVELESAREHPRRGAYEAPTWIANPTLTEQDTRDEEEDDVVWAREYAAIPMRGDVRAWFDASAIDDALKGFSE